MTCSNPIITRGGYKIGCRKCKSCRAATVYDKVGRAYAEAAAHPEGTALSVALTMGQNDRYDVPADNMLAHVLQPSMLRGWFQRLRKAVKASVAKARPDLAAAVVQLKRLRKAGLIGTATAELLELGRQFRELTTVRYMIAGEHGKKRGRAHYHALVFFRTRDLPAGIVLEKPKHNDGIWHAGFSYWKPMNENDAFYTCKYCLKDQDHVETASLGVRQLYFSMSRHPPLGADYFRHEARRAAAQQLPFRNTYGFAELRYRKKIRQDDGSEIEISAVREFKLSRASLKLAADEYMSSFRQIHGHDHWPQSEVLERYEDELAAGEPEAIELQAHKDELFRQRVAEKATLKSERYKRSVLRDMRSQQRLRDVVIDDALNAALGRFDEDEWNARFGGREFVRRGQVLAAAADSDER